MSSNYALALASFSGLNSMATHSRKWGWGEEQNLLKTLSKLRTSLTNDAGLGGTDCILHMEARGTASATGAGDVSLDF